VLAASLDVENAFRMAREYGYKIYSSCFIIF